MALFGKADAGLPFLTRFAQLEEGELQEFIRDRILPEEDLRAGRVAMDISPFPPGVMGPLSHKSTLTMRKMLPLCRSIMLAKALGGIPSSLEFAKLERVRDEWLMPMYFVAEDDRPLVVLWQPRLQNGIDTPGLVEAPLPDWADLDDYEEPCMIEHFFDQSLLHEYDIDEEDTALKRMRAAWTTPVSRVTYADMYAPFVAELLSELQDVVEGRHRVARCEECRSPFVVTRVGQIYCSRRCVGRVTTRRQRQQSSVTQ